MTSSQTKLYWRSWNAAKRAAHLEESDRHELHRKTLGTDKSSTALTNTELDKILATFAALSHPADLNAQLRQQDQPRTRLLWAIRLQIKLLAVLVDDPESYVAAILRDRFHARAIESLRSELSEPRPLGSVHTTPKPRDTPPVEQSALEMMRFTLVRAVLRLRQRTNLTPADLEALATEGRRYQQNAFRNTPAPAPHATHPINLNREIHIEEPAHQ